MSDQPLSAADRAGLLDAIHAAVLRQSNSNLADPHRVPPEQLATIERHLDEMIELVRQTKAARSETYQARMVQEICANCRSQDVSGFCKARQDHVCALFIHLRPIVQVIATFLSRRNDAAYEKTHPTVDVPDDADKEPRMIRRILIAVNENRSSQYALQVGSALATVIGAEVRLVHVVFPPLSDLDLGDTVPRAETLVTAGEALLAGYKHALPEGLDADTRVRQGRPADEIIATAREWNADLIVIGDHRPHSQATFVLGNTSDAVIRHAPCPVLLARRTEWPTIEPEAAENRTRVAAEQRAYRP